ncbi:LOW QUALITY PROTEIN: ABC transporter C family member 10 [Amborella trichopoda]|uniref:LOW QUALITY PROTEIN: ABC transporter C family member 10 n=1 Tax=Amborella trichopoda TaxID=13333 RepID=UPI0009C15240|nr:LOW QUALITY PROTEIN: ABC transporter C family member 10 [Amborella trichopoda]|eukprot:XP_020522199.1 LOW QUALITY PROTEIN: ABC transporter C family member 10 [Amborella trichopoda]
MIIGIRSWSLFLVINDCSIERRNRGQAMDILTGIWVAFCGELNPLSTEKKYGQSCNLGFSGCAIATNSGSSLCIKHGLILFVDAVLLLMYVFHFVHKKPIPLGALSGFRSFSPSQKFTATFIAILGFSYMALGGWSLTENMRKGKILPFHQWLVLLVQGFTLTLVGLTASLKAKRLAKTFLRIWSIVVLLFAGFLCISAIVNHMISGEFSPSNVLDVISLPGGLLLFICAIKGSGESGQDTASYMPLNNGPIGKVESHLEESVTSIARAGLLSRMTFWWLNPLMKKGRQKSLEEKDMPELSLEDQAGSCYDVFTEELNQRKHMKLSGSPSIFWVLVFCNRKEMLVSGLFALLKILTLSSGPLLLNAFIKVAEGGEIFRYEGFILAFSLFFAKVLESISQRQWYFRTRRIGLKLRSVLSAAVYQKQLRLSNEGKLMHSAGEIMNYVTVDAYRIGEFPYWFHQTWTTSLQICIALAILLNSVGPATISALVVIVLTVLCNSPLAKLQHKFQTKLMMAQDERLKAMTEAFFNMKVLKLYAWETHFRLVIEALRKVEYKWLSAYQMRRAYNSFLFWASPVLVSAATFGTCYLLRVPLYPSNVFTFVATLRLVQDPIRMIPDVIGTVIQARVALTRIINFLEAPELQNGFIKRKFEDTSEHAIVIDSPALSWKRDLSKPTLRNINLCIHFGQKVAICGEVGSGKSTLLAAILGEVPNIEGRMEVGGTVAYVSQTAWIQSGTIQENILFGSPMCKEKYQVVIEKCSLLKDLEMLPFGDLTEIGERGVNLSGGQKQRIQLARAVYQDADIYLLDDPFSAVDAHTATGLFNECVMGVLSMKTILLVTHQVDLLPSFDTILLMSDGEILRAAPYQELLSNSREFQDLVNAHKDTLDSQKIHAGSSPRKFDSITSGKETKKEYMNNQPLGKASESNQLIKEEEKETGDTGLKPYMQYLNQNKGFLFFSLAALSHIAFAITQVLQNTWMAANVQNSLVSTLRLICVYSAIGVTGAVFLLLRSIFVVTLGLQSSKSLFTQFLISVFRAPMSFFDSTPLGRILSRISSDLSIVDLDVPFSLTFSVSATTNMYFNLGVLASVTWQVLFVSIPMVYLTICLQRYYFASAKDLMRMNGTTKSQIANHLSESISGAIIVRAFGEEDRFSKKNLYHIDKNASPFFHNFAASEWLIFRLELLSASVLSASALAMVLLPSGTFSSGFIGMALSYGLSLNMSLVGSIQNQCILANHIISVERINQYMHIPSEAPEVIEGIRPSPGWPNLGKVEIQDLKIRYRPDTPLVLRGITCTFEGGHKIGIVGRTGSGKTTLISALFRLIEPVGGRILVDGLDISKIGLHDLRSHFGIIPQEPTLFHGTVRYNLDPLSEHSDQEIWEVLGKCQLRETVRDKEDGLDVLVLEDGSNWSMGQRQLFCLGRALLKRSKILVLDEATASIDNATDSILQRTIREEFADCTVITVAHRIPTVMDCTMVLAISDGILVEYEEPSKLMQQEGSLFRELVKEYWSHMGTSNSL